MELPYTSTPVDAWMAAQTSVAAAFTAVVWHRPMRPVVASALLVAAVWLCVLLPVAPDIVASVAKYPTSGDVFLLQASAMLAAAAMLLSRPRWLAWVAVVGAVLFAWCESWIIDSNVEIGGAQIVFFAVLYALHARFTRPWERPREPSTVFPPRAREDAVIFALALALAVVVAWFVMDHVCDSADEVAYQWQAFVLARFKAWAPVPPCPDPHRSHWIFYENGKSVSMYLPGWPLFMAPFARWGVGWLASSVSFAAMVLGCARVARRLGGVFAGRVAAVAATLGASTLLNAGSRFPHVFVAATWVWSIEALCAFTAIGSSTRAQWLWGVVLGVAMGLCISTRPTDAAVLACGLFVVFVADLVRRKLPWRSLLSTIVSFGAVCGLTLVILHSQFGVWFTTGYGIATKYYWWTKLVLDLPARDAWKYGLPFMTAAYCFFPAAAALAAAGLVFAGRRIAWMLGTGSAAHLAFYVYCAFGRYRDFGYGPRYHLPLVVAMAVGTGVFLAPLFHGLRGMKAWPALLVREGPATVVAVACLLGVFRLAPMMFPFAHEQLHRRSALQRAIERDHLTHAAVVVFQNEIYGGPLLNVQNDPFDADPNVVILGPEDQGCTRALYKDRKFYRAVGQDEVRLEPY